MSAPSKTFDGPGNRPAHLALTASDDPARMRVKPLGVANFGDPVLVGLAVADARHHMHVIGPTGVGKSTFLVNHTLAEVDAGRGVVVLDPKGDLVRDLLDRLPVKAAGRLVLIDPDETQAPAAFNLLGLSHDPHEIADQLIGVMSKVWAQYWGPRTDDLARHTVLTAAHLPDATLADLPKLLTERSLRRLALRRAARSGDQIAGTDLAGAAGLEAFWGWWDSLTPGAQSQHIGPLISKLRAVLSRPFTARLFGTPRSTFRLDEVLDGGILLVRLPKSLGEDTAKLTGSLLAALLHEAAKRADLPEQDRLDATLIVDECHNFVNLPIGLDSALAETRAWRLEMVLSHQHLGQLSTSMFEAIDANARSKVFFALAPSDAKRLAHHVAPWFPPAELVRRDAFGVVVRIVIDGQDSEPFTLQTRPAPQYGQAAPKPCGRQPVKGDCLTRNGCGLLKPIACTAPHPHHCRERTLPCPPYLLMMLHLLGVAVDPDVPPDPPPVQTL